MPRRRANEENNVPRKRLNVEDPDLWIPQHDPPIHCPSGRASTNAELTARSIKQQQQVAALPVEKSAAIQMLLYYYP